MPNPHAKAVLRRMRAACHCGCRSVSAAQRWLAVSTCASGCAPRPPAPRSRPRGTSRGWRATTDGSARDSRARILSARSLERPAVGPLLRRTTIDCSGRALSLFVHRTRRACTCRLSPCAYGCGESIGPPRGAEPRDTPRASPIDTRAATRERAPSRSSRRPRRSCDERGSSRGSSLRAIPREHRSRASFVSASSRGAYGTDACGADNAFGLEHCKVCTRSLYPRSPRTAPGRPIRHRRTTRSPH